MTTQSNSTDVANRFGAIAQEFCSLVESASKKDRTSLLIEVYRVLPRLINEAISLPIIRTVEEDHEPEEQSRSVRMTEGQWGELAGF
jgi:hypothetical protein